MHPYEFDNNKKIDVSSNCPKDAEYSKLKVAAPILGGIYCPTITNKLGSLFKTK
jgi:hypothetical protein